jgi:hypothetical protein
MYTICGPSETADQMAHAQLCVTSHVSNKRLARHVQDLSGRHRSGDWAINGWYCHADLII